MTPKYLTLARVLRVFGCLDFAALLAVAAPYQWLNRGALLAGTGPLPQLPLVDYLVRAGCAMYALHGAVIFFVSFDVRRYRPLIRFLAWFAVFHGAIVFGIDWSAGMPLWWRCVEGPTFSATGILVLWLLGRASFQVIVDANPWQDCSPPISPKLSVWPGDVAFSRTLSLTLAAGDSVNLSSIQTTLHLGSHADAPCHFADDGPSIDQISIDKFVGPARVLGVAVDQLLPDRRIPVAALVGPLDNLPPRILLKTGTFDPFQPYSDRFASLAPELVDWLADRGVVLIGIDTPSVDPLNDKSLASHHRLNARSVANLEGLLLESVPPGDYEMVAVPLRLEGADASPVRVALRKVD